MARKNITVYNSV